MQNSSRMKFETSDSWTILSTIEQQIRRKIEQAGIPLKEWNLNIYRGILTGFNEAFIISSEKKDELIAADPKSAEIIRPILRGKDIKKYSFNFADLWIINVHNGIKELNIAPINVDEYPAIKEHLDYYYPQLAKRADKGITPYNLRNCAYMNDFFQQKIVYREISNAMDACMVESGVMLNNKCYLITGDHLVYLLAFFNSTLFTKIILPQANTTGGKGEKFLHSIKAIPPVDDDEKIIVSEYERFNENKISLKEFSDFADDYFYRLYELSPSEIKYLTED